jgi:hypothetical protein
MGCGRGLQRTKALTGAPGDIRMCDWKKSGVGRFPWHFLTASPRLCKSGTRETASLHSRVQPEYRSELSWWSHSALVGELRYHGGCKLHPSGTRGNCTQRSELSDCANCATHSWTVRPQVRTYPGASLPARADRHRPFLYAQGRTDRNGSCMACQSPIAVPHVYWASMVCETRIHAAGVEGERRVDCEAGHRHSCR